MVDPGASPLAGTTCVVTGANRGIGLETARGLWALGARVVLVGRNRAALDVAARGIAGGDRLETAVGDFASLASVRALAGELGERFPRIHVLVNNAGIHVPRRALSADGIELTFAVNHLAPYLLTRLLLDPLRAAAPARVVAVASAAHVRARDLDDVVAPRRYWSVVAYAKSKAANVLFASELARRLEGSGVTSNSLHPGTIDTGLLRNAFAGLTRLPFLYALTRPFLKGPVEGARTSLLVATAPELEGVTGKYFVGSRAAAPSRLARDPAVARRLWDESARLTGLEP